MQFLIGTAFPWNLEYPSFSMLSILHIAPIGRIAREESEDYSTASQ